MQSIDDLANVITDLDPSEQQTLLVAQLNFQKGLHDLADRCRARLARESQLDVSSEQVMVELHRIREQIAELDYPA